MHYDGLKMSACPDKNVILFRDSKSSGIPCQAFEHGSSVLFDDRIAVVLEHRGG